MKEIRINLSEEELKEVKGCADWVKIAKIFNEAYQRGDWTIY